MPRWGNGGKMRCKKLLNIVVLKWFVTFAHICSGKWPWWPNSTARKARTQKNTHRFALSSDCLCHRLHLWSLDISLLLFAPYRSFLIPLPRTNFKIPHRNSIQKKYRNFQIFKAFLRLSLSPASHRKPRLGDLKQVHKHLQGQVWSVTCTSQCTNEWISCLFSSSPISHVNWWVLVQLSSLQPSLQAYQWCHGLIGATPNSLYQAHSHSWFWHMLACAGPS